MLQRVISNRRGYKKLQQRAWWWPFWSTIAIEGRKPDDTDFL